MSLFSSAVEGIWKKNVGHAVEPRFDGKRKSHFSAPENSCHFTFYDICHVSETRLVKIVLLGSLQSVRDRGRQLK